MEKSGDISLERRAKKKGVQNSKETEKGELGKILKEPLAPSVTLKASRLKLLLSNK